MRNDISTTFESNIADASDSATKEEQKYQAFDCCALASLILAYKLISPWDSFLIGIVDIHLSV